MIYNVRMDPGKWNLAPATELEEILQNVRVILTTIKKSVPMDRELGVDADIVDLPIAAAQTKLTAEIVAAIAKFEPRARCVGVIYSGNEMDGILQPTVRVAIEGRS